MHQWFFNNCDWTVVIMPYVAVPYLQQMGPNATLQQDNARPHAPRAVITFMQQSNVDVLDWPACSPDLNLIEHVWDQLCRAVHQRLTPKHEPVPCTTVLTRGVGQTHTCQYPDISYQDEGTCCCMYRCAFIGPTKY